MKLLLPILAPLAALLLTGCVAVSANMAGVPTSRYQPLLASEADKTRWLQEVEAIKGKIVEDERGQYFFDAFEENGARHFAALVLHKPYVELGRAMLAQGVGVLEPVYRARLAGNGTLHGEIDWAETQLLHKAMSTVFKLAPLSTSRTYAALLDDWKKTLERQYAREYDKAIQPKYANPLIDMADKLTDEKGMHATALRNDYSLYGKGFQENVLAKLEADKVGFVIGTSITVNSFLQGERMFDAMMRNPAMRAANEQTARAVPSYANYVSASRLTASLQTYRWATIGSRIDWGFLSGAVYRDLKVTGMSGAPNLITLSVTDANSIPTTEKLTRNSMSSKSVALGVIGASDSAYRSMAEDARRANSQLLAEINDELANGAATRARLLLRLQAHLNNARQAMGITTGLRSNTLR